MSDNYNRRLREADEENICYRASREIWSHLFGFYNITCTNFSKEDNELLRKDFIASLDRVYNYNNFKTMGSYIDKGKDLTWSHGSPYSCGNVGGCPEGKNLEMWYTATIEYWDTDEKFPTKDFNALAMPCAIDALSKFYPSIVNCEIRMGRATARKKRYARDPYSCSLEIECTFTIIMNEQAAMEILKGTDENPLTEGYDNERCLIRDDWNVIDMYIDDADNSFVIEYCFPEVYPPYDETAKCADGDFSYEVSLDKVKSILRNDREFNRRYYLCDNKGNPVNWDDRNINRYLSNFFKSNQYCDDVRSFGGCYVDNLIGGVFAGDAMEEYAMKHGLDII